MTDNFMISYYKIKNIINFDLIIKKLRIKKEIKNLKKILYSKIKKDVYTAIDIIDLALLVDTCISLKILKKDFVIKKSDIFSSIKYTKNSSLKWPIAGSLVISVLDYNFCINAYRESDYDLEGFIQLECKKKNSEDSINIRYSTDINEFAENTCEITTGVSRDLINILFKMIPDIFILYTESILDGLKEKYL